MRTYTHSYSGHLPCGSNKEGRRHNTPPDQMTPDCILSFGAIFVSVTLYTFPTPPGVREDRGVAARTNGMGAGGIRPPPLPCTEPVSHSPHDGGHCNHGGGPGQGRSANRPVHSQCIASSSPKGENRGATARGIVVVVVVSVVIPVYTPRCRHYVLIPVLPPLPPLLPPYLPPLPPPFRPPPLPPPPPLLPPRPLLSAFFTIPTDTGWTG